MPGIEGLHHRNGNRRRTQSNIDVLHRGVTAPGQIRATSILVVLYRPSDKSMRRTSASRSCTWTAHAQAGAVPEYDKAPANARASSGTLSL